MADLRKQNVSHLSHPPRPSCWVTDMSRNGAWERSSITRSRKPNFPVPEKWRKSMADLRKCTSRENVSQLSHNFPKCVCALIGGRTHGKRREGGKAEPRAALAEARHTTTEEEAT